MEEPVVEEPAPVVEEPTPVEQQAEPTPVKNSNMAYWLVTVLIVITVGAALFWMTLPIGKRKKH